MARDLLKIPRPIMCVTEEAAKGDEVEHPR
jgi:hypothetical protein